LQKILGLVQLEETQLSSPSYLFAPPFLVATVLTLISKMYSHLRQKVFSSKLNFGTRRHGNRAKFSPFKLVSAPRNFQSFVQRQGQEALAASPRYEPALEYENVEEFTRSQSPAPQAPTSSSHSSAFTASPDLTSNVPELDVSEAATLKTTVPLYYRHSKFDKEPYWRKIGRWKDVTQEQFLSHRWNVSSTGTSPSSSDNANQL
jgi:hypothetical protein